MNIKNCVAYSLHNIVKNKKNTLHIFIALSFISVIAIVFLAYYFSIVNTINGMINESISSNYIQVKINDQTDFNKISQVKNIKGVNETRKILSAFSELSNIQVKIGDKSYNTQEELAFIDFQYRENNGSIFTENEKKEYTNRFGEKNSILQSGRDVTDKNEVLISENILEFYGIEDTVSVLGKSIEILQLFDNVTILENHTIVGVVKSNFFDLTSNLGMEKVIYLDYDNANGNLDNSFYALNVYIADFNDAESVTSELLKLFSIEHYGVTYQANSISQNINALLDQRQLAMNIFWLTGAILIFAVLVCLLSVVIFNIKQKKDYFGILKANGLTNPKLFLIFFFEMLIIYCLVFVFSFAVSALLMNIISGILSNTLAVTLLIDMLLLLKIAALAFCCGLIVCFIISIVSLHFVRKSSICLLLKN